MRKSPTLEMDTAPAPATSVVMTQGPAGPRARVADGLDVWEYVMVAKSLDGSAAGTAEHLQEPLSRVTTALAYYEAHSTEIDAWLAEMDRIDRELSQATG